MSRRQNRKNYELDKGDDDDDQADVVVVVADEAAAAGGEGNNSAILRYLSRPYCSDKRDNQVDDDGYCGGDIVPGFCHSAGSDICL